MSSESFDVVVVGAGPAGSSAARFAAQGGCRTVLLDRRERLGDPVQCGEFLPSPEELEDLLHCPDAIRASYEIPPETVLHTIRRMVCVAPSGRRYDFPIQGLSVDRLQFDPALAARAEAAGAELRHPVGVVRVDDDTVTLASGEKLRAKVVIGADGPLSVVARSMGFQIARQMYRMITATSDLPSDDAISLYFGHLAPGGYAWSIPQGDSANVGLGARYIPRGESLSHLLASFTAHEGMPPAHDPTRWWVPLGPPPESAVRGRALFVGDAANMVMATNGAGIPTAMVSGYDAGEAAARHVREGTPLTHYDERWRSHLYEPLFRGWEIKRWGDRVVDRDWLLTLGMRYIGSGGLDSVMRLRWPRRVFWRNS
jgi:digeranylgeranylglycerophospholipid reductase